MSIVRLKVLTSILIFAQIHYDHGTCSPTSQEQQTKIAVRKCCPRESYYLLHQKICNSSKHEFNFKIPQPVDDATPKYNADFNISYNEKPRCQNGALIVLNDTRFEFYKNGTLMTVSPRRAFSEFCFEYSEAYNGTAVVFCNYSKQAEPETANNFNYLLPGYFSSIVFLVLTLIVHLLLNRDEPLSMHAALLRCHILTFILQYCCLLYMIQVRMERGFTCYFSGLVTQFFILVNFFWMNAVCIDMWLTITKFRFSVSSQFTRHMFLRYCLYALGIPFIITIVTALAQFFNIFGTKLNPGMGLETCTFKGFLAQFIYLYDFVMIITIVNTYFFSSIAFKIFNENKKWENGGSSVDRTSRHNYEQNQRKTFFLYLKLFLIMGLNWFTDVLDFVFQGDRGIFHYTQIFNSFLGVIIFGIVFANRKSSIQLKRNLYPNRINSKRYATSRR